jgi:hypothetical protein
MKSLFLIFGILVWFGQSQRIYFPQADYNKTTLSLSGDFLCIRKDDNTEIGAFTSPFGFSWITDRQFSILDYDGSINCIGVIEIENKN